MFDVILFQPEIPPNTGNVIRLCANTGARLHLVRPLGFSLEDAQLRRAGLDYHEYADVKRHAGWAEFIASAQPDLARTFAMTTRGTRFVHDALDEALAAIAPKRLFALTTRGSARFDQPRYEAGDAFLFGPETRGLPEDVLALVPAAQRLRLPMRPNNRSLNLSNAVAVVVFEAWRQYGFSGGA